MEPSSPKYWTKLTRIYLALLGARVLLYALRYGSPEDLMTTTRLHPYLDGAQISALVGGIVAGLIWVYRAWSRLPPPQRKSWNGRDVEPDSAAIRILFPFYNFYWIFVANVGLAAALDRHLASQGKPPAKLGNFAIACCIVQLIPIANLLASPLLWGVFMARVDAVQAQAEQRA